MSKRKTKNRVTLPTAAELPEIIEGFPYSLEQTAVLTNCGTKSTVYRYIREGIWPVPIRVGAKPAYLGSTVKAICRGELARAA